MKNTNITNAKTNLENINKNESENETMNTPAIENKTSENVAKAIALDMDINSKASTTSTKPYKHATNIDRLSIPELVNLLNDSDYTPQHFIMKTMIEDALKAEAIASKKAEIEFRINSAKTDVTDFFTNYIKSPYYRYFSLKQDKNSKEWSLIHKQAKLNYIDIDDQYGKSNNGVSISTTYRYIGMLSYFAHNLIKAVGDEMIKNSDGSKVVTLPIKQRNEKEEKRYIDYDFSGFSKTALEKQLQAIVNTILPEAVSVKMLRADVRYILHTVVNGKNTDNNKGKMTLKSEKAILETIFVCINHRINNLEYEVKSYAEIHKVKKSDVTA